MSLAQEQMACQQVRPPRDLVGSAQNRVDFAMWRTKAAPLHGREQVAFEKDAFGPLR